MDIIKKITWGTSPNYAKDITKKFESFIDVNKLDINTLFSIQKENNKLVIKHNKSQANNVINIVYIFLGKVPPYILESFHQLKCWTNSPVYLITDDKSVNDLLEGTGIKVIYYDDIKDQKCEIMHKYKENFYVVNGLNNREYLFFYSMLRFVILEAFMRKYALNNIFHLEIDNLIYFDISKYSALLFSKSLAYSIDNFRMGSAALFFVKNVDSIDKMNNVLLDYVINKRGPMQEMIFLGEYQRQLKNEVLVLPSIFDNYKADWPEVSENYKLFGSELLFDPVHIGIGFTGRDSFHTNGIKRNGFGEHTGAHIDYTKCVIEWEYGYDKKWPIIKYDGKLARLANLHIHSKDLISNMSCALPKPINKRFISGEELTNLCQMTVTANDNECVDSKWINLTKINAEFDNPKLIYVNFTALHLLADKLQFFKNKCVLVYHNSDIHITSSHYPILNHDKVVAFYAQNLIVDHPKGILLPIGIANNRWPHGNKVILERVVNKNIMFTPGKIYFYFNIFTNAFERQDCFDKLCKKGLKWGKENNFETYLTKIKKCEFVICPPGNGTDTHRFWEVIYLGRIPIVKNNVIIQKLKPFFKMVILNDWSDLNLNNIEVSMPNQYPKLWLEDYINDIKMRVEAI